MQRSSLMAAGLWGFVLVALLALGSRGLGQLPPLGPLLEPAGGVWGLAATAERPSRETVPIPGMQDTVRIIFDDRAVPHIFASNSDDAARALGYVVARDRLFQLEMRWRTTAGRLTELVGEGALEVDRRVRGLGLAWSAERHFARIDSSSSVFRQVAAYAEGVNAWIDGMGAAELPLEYRLLSKRPARWEPIYSLYILKLMGWDLTYAVTVDLARLRAQARIGELATDALFPRNSPIQQPIEPNGERGPRYAFRSLPPPGDPDADALSAARALERRLGPLAWELDYRSARQMLGSNNWAVAPGRTAGGHALLAGDPHLGLSLPSTWYEAHLQVPGELDVYGVTFPSVPFIVIGFNRDLAWSFTNTGADVIDYYREQLDDPDAPAAYRLDGEWRPLEQRIERYRDPQGESLAVDTLRFTHRGPLIEDAGEALSMRWTVLDGGGETESLAGIASARSVQEWLRVMEDFGAPAQNGVVADRRGSIAIRSTGHFPIHPDGSGLTVRDGRFSTSDWRGFWPLSRYPFALEPEQGYLASANQQPIDPAVEPGYLGADWPPPWRAIRINQLLSGDSAVTVDAMRRYQTDPGSARAEYFVPHLLAAVERRGLEGEVAPDALTAAALLADWDRRYTLDNEHAILFEYTMEKLGELTWDELNVAVPGQDVRAAPSPSSAILAVLMEDPESVWWDDRHTEAVENRDEIVVRSLSAALQRARAEHGAPKDGGWRWELIRHANIYHLLGLPTLSALGIPLQGGPSTLNPSDGRGTHGASWRMVVELGPSVRAWTIYPGGQSGNPISPFYDDRIDRWSAGELDPARFPLEPADLAPERVSSVLTLTPVIR